VPSLDGSEQVERVVDDRVEHSGRLVPQWSDVEDAERHWMGDSDSINVDQHPSSTFLKAYAMWSVAGYGAQMPWLVIWVVLVNRRTCPTTTSQVPSSFPAVA